MATHACGLMAETITQINMLQQLSSLDDAALFARFNNDPDQAIAFMRGFNLSFNATRVADMADRLSDRLIVIARSQSNF